MPRVDQYLEQLLGMPGDTEASVSVRRLEPLGILAVASRCGLLLREPIAAPVQPSPSRANMPPSLLRLGTDVASHLGSAATARHFPATHNQPGSPPAFERPRKRDGPSCQLHVAPRVGASRHPFGPEAWVVCALMEQALTQALVALEPMPPAVLHGIVSDDWLPADEPHFDAAYPQWTFSV